MRDLSLKIILRDGAETRVIKFPARATGADACRIVQEKLLTGEDGTGFGLFLPSADDDLSGIWLDDSQPLTHYLLRDKDSLHYRSKVRTLRLRTLDGAVKTIQVDESKPVESLMMSICAKLGITNYEEYGLCRDEEPQEAPKPATGTLTLKRKPKTREKDLAMDQLSKKLKTDDNVDWLEQHKTLRESKVPPSATLLLARRLYYSDRRVDTRDPTQLRLLYVQARDGLLGGRHPVTEDRAVEFAGIQCQIQFGDHQENKHKPGFIENLNEFLPAAYASSRGVEKLVLREHRKHAGLNELEAQFLYTQTVRGLPTYGVTFFLVKEILEGKKKLVPRLLGISANAVLRMDVNTKEVLNEWPLTQIRTYMASRGELFTLNFGDYSDREYCVKTNDAIPIRDILQSYIDLIRKKMAGPFNATADEGGAIYTATVESSKGTTIEVVTHNASKAVETSFVGPSRIISYEHGSKAQAQGAQIMTAQQVIVMNKHHNQQTAMAGGVATRNANDMSAGTVRRLNELNGNAVKIVELLTEPSQEKISDANKIIEGIKDGMPELVEGVKQCIDQQTDEEGRQLLTSQLQDLQATVGRLEQFKNPEDAKEAAMKVADLTTQMYFALDPRTRRRSQLVKMSRKSFVEDERTQAKLQRASFSHTVAGTGEAIDDAKHILDKKYSGAPLSPEEVSALERSARDRLARLNAAIALFVAAHSDPKNINYAAAVNSMNTIKKLMPELAKDVQALSAVEDGIDRSQLVQQMKELCDAAELICRNTGCDDLEKLHGAADDYAKKSKRLLFTFSRGIPPPQQNEIIELAKGADERARLLLSTAAQLVDRDGAAADRDGAAADTLRAAAARCGHAARGLRACVELTASSIHEPHCRSALAAASEELSSAAQALAHAGRPLASPEGQEVLNNQTGDLLKALERLNAFADVDGDSPEARGRRRLQFTTTLADAQAALAGCDVILDDDKPPAPPGTWLGQSLPARLAALGAAVASLLKAARDSENPDYEAAEEAMATIQRLMPGVVRDIKWDSHRLPEQRRRELQADLRALRDALQALAADTKDGKDPSDSVAEFARASGKLAYVFDRRAKPDREHRIIDLAKSSCQKASELLSPVSQLATATAGELGATLDARGSDVADSAQTLLTTALLTAPTCHISPAKDALLRSAQHLIDAMDKLSHAWAAQPDQRQELDARKNLADDEIRQLIAALNEIPDELSELKEDPVRQKKRVRFMFSLSQAGDAVDKAEKDIDKAITSSPLTPAQEKSARLSLADKLAALNAAVAALTAATQDRSNPDYEAVERASAAIQQLLPQVIEETKALSAGKDDADRRALLEELKALCAATKEMSSGAGDYVKVPSDAVARYARAVNRLAFVCTPRAQAPEDQQVLEKSNAVSAQSQALLAAAEGLPGAAGAAREALAAAEALRDATRLTSSSLQSPDCRSALLRAASALSQAVAKLDEACRTPGQASALAEQRQAFDKAVEELMASIRSLEGTQDIVSPEQEKRRLKFVTTQKATQKALDDAAKELAKAGKAAPLAPPQANALQLSLSDRLATLNAAIAALLTATRDAEKPDYEAAESATATIQELIPDLVKDSKSISASKEPAAREKLLENLRELCEATKALNGGELRGKEQELNDAVKKYTTASGQLVYTFNPRAGYAKEDQIIDLSKSTCERTSELLSQVYQLADAVGGAKAEDLDARGARVADAAQSLLTAAEITAPSIGSPLCQSSLLASVDGLSSSVEQLAVCWQPGQRLDAAKTRVDEEIAKLRDAVRSGNAGHTETEAKRERLRFTNSLASTKAAVDAAEKALNEASGGPASPAACAALRGSLAGALAALGAAVAALVAAARDEQNPDYAMAESASTTIRELLPDIIKDTKTLSNSEFDPKSGEELLDQVRALCDATRRLCAGAGQASPSELNEAASQFSLASGKLDFAFRPHADQERANQIIESCKAACIKTSGLLQRVHSLSAHTQNEALDRRGAAVSDAATALLTTAQLTAHTAHSPSCQQALLQAADDLTSSLQGLQATWAPVIKDPRLKPEGEQLEEDKRAVDMEVEGLKGLVRESKDVKQKTKPAVPTRPRPKVGPGGERAALVATDHFLDNLRKEASSEGVYERAKYPAIQRSEEEKRAKSRFHKSVEDARKSICTAEESLRKYLKSDSKPRASLDDAQMRALSKQMEHKLARANAAAAHLLACRSGEKSDYTVASKCVGAVSDLLPTIVTDAKTLGDLKDEHGRKAFLNDTLGLCTASLKLCETSKSDKKKLTEAALAFADQSSKLLYAVSTDIDPSQENEVLLRVRVAGDAAVRLTERGGDQRTSGRCASLATVLMYTAKLVAPCVQDPECQDTLISATKDLSSQLRSFPTNQPELSAELADLESLLEALRKDVAAGTLVKRRERLVFEDTPFKSLTEQVIEYAKQDAESPTRPEAERRALAALANELTGALHKFHVANARCKNAPHDMKRRGELEDAVYDVQHLVLQERPGVPQKTIVDLADYLTSVSSDASNLLQATQRPGLATGPSARAAAAVGQQAQLVTTAAERARVGGDVDHAVKECVNRVQKINTAVECCAEGAEKNTLKKEARPLNESCALLQFAAQSADATTRCAALDAALADLSELDQRIDAMLMPGEARTPAQVGSTPSPALLSSRSRLATASADCSRNARDLAPAFTRYVAALRAQADVTDPATKRRLADHLKKLQEHLKLLAMETGRRLQTWRPAQDSSSPDQLLQELDNMEAVIGVTPATTAGRIAPEDLRKLLLPAHSYAVEGDSKQLEAKLESSATKLNSMLETLTLSVNKPESLARTAHVTAESAVQLAAIARAMKTDEDPSKSSKIEEASQELCFVTYNLLKTAESVSHEPNSFESRRRLRDACRALTDAINKLVNTSSTADRLRKECNELARSLQPHGLTARPASASPYADCLDAIHAQHDTIENLKSDQPMSREEFCTSLRLLSSAVSADVEHAEHCAYLLSIADQHPELAKEGMFDGARAQALISAAEDTCFRTTRSGIEHQATEESTILAKQLLELREAVEKSSAAVKDAAVKQQLLEGSSRVEAAGAKLQAVLSTQNVTADMLTQPAFAAVEALSALEAATRHQSLAPRPQTNKHADEVLDQSKELVGRATALMRAVKMADSQQAMTWVMFNTYTKGVLEASDNLITTLRTNGQNAGILLVEEIEEEADVAFKSYVQTQVAIANKWLSKPTYKPQIKKDGETAARNVIDVGKKMATHLKDGEAEEMRHLSDECEQLLVRCRDKYDHEIGSLLMDRLKDLARAVDRCIVTMVVEDLMEDQEPLADLDILVEAETDVAKRKFVLERKIKDLLAHLARVTKTARALADGRNAAPELLGCTDRAALLAPMLVKAAEKRVIFPKELAVVEDYERQLAQYSQSLSRVQDLCDRAVDPMQFVQTAEEKMQKMKEESTSHQNDLRRCSNTSTAIRNLAHRVIHVGMSSARAQRDPELMRALAQAQARLTGAAPARGLRASKLPDWNNSIAEILRATGEVESVLGGEMIFNKLPETDQPIYNAARDLHAAVRDWSARDNDIVSSARRMAVLMARLSAYMHADKKREVISTSKAIVAASHEVARLARKLALECSDIRIRTNLLQLCDQNLTISAQLQMLSNVKKSSFGHQGNEDDIEAMNMLVGNAQNLMLTIQKTVEASFGASVQIQSKRGGPRIRWVRKHNRQN